MAPPRPGPACERASGPCRPTHRRPQRWLGREAFEGQGPQRWPQRRFGRRLEEVAKAVGGGYCRLQMPLKLALGVRGTVTGHRLGALEGGGGGNLPPPSNASLELGTSAHGPHTDHDPPAVRPVPRRKSWTGPPVPGPWMRPLGAGPASGEVWLRGGQGRNGKWSG